METKRNKSGQFVERADINKLREVFDKYASKTDEEGLRFMTNEDFVVHYLKLLPEENYNKDTLNLFAGVIDSNKDDRITFEELLMLERSLCHPDSLYRTIFQLFDTNGGGSVSFDEFQEIMSKTLLHQKIPFDLESSFVQLYFGAHRDREIVFSEFCQFLHTYHEEYSKYAFKAFDSDEDGKISVEQFCDIMFTIKNHILTPEVRKHMLQFIKETEGAHLSFAYCTAFRAMLTNMEEMKKIYLEASQGSRTKEISLDSFMFTAQQVSQATPLEVDILFKLSQWINESETIIYSDLQKIAPEVYMKNVTKRLVDIKLVESADQRTGLIELLESVYRFCVGSLSGLCGAGVVYPIDLIKTRMMNQRDSKEMLSTRHAYHDTMDCIKKTLRYEGVSGLYRGLSLYLSYVAPEKAIKLATNDFIRDKISEANHGHISLSGDDDNNDDDDDNNDGDNSDDDDDDDDDDVSGEMMAGACSGLANVLFSNPLEIVKIRLQVAGAFSTLHTHTAWTVFKQLGENNGKIFDS